MTNLDKYKEKNKKKRLQEVKKVEEKTQNTNTRNFHSLVFINAASLSSPV